jgi:hypothetical protein
MKIPAWVVDFESYRLWAHSVELPKRTQVAYLDGEIWVDASGEDLFTHGNVRSAVGLAIHNSQEKNVIGRFVAAGMFYTNRHANLAIEPDGMFYLWTTMQVRAATIDGKDGQ